MEGDYIRPPDPIKRDRLLDDYDHPISEEDQLAHLVVQSEMEYELRLAMEESEMDAIIRMERQTHFTEVKPKLAQLQKLDKDNSELYATIIGFISEYESGALNRVAVNPEFHNSICRVLNTMRVASDQKLKLLEIIVTQ